MSVYDCKRGKIQLFKLFQYCPGDFGVGVGVVGSDYIAVIGGDGRVQKSENSFKAFQVFSIYICGKAAVGISELL